MCIENTVYDAEFESVNFSTEGEYFSVIVALFVNFEALRAQ
jgi:hypothetical protein